VSSLRCPGALLAVTKPAMAKSRFEVLKEQAAFKVTSRQLEWLRSASVKARQPSLSEWLRTLAVTAGGSLMDTPFPEREFISPDESPPKPAKKQRRR
jgi:hypothetical protein